MIIINKELLLFFERLINSVNSSFYEGAFWLFCIGTLVLLVLKGFKKGIRGSCLLALIEYVVLVFLSTVLCRVTRTVREYDWHPFWSYQTVGNGWHDLLVQNIMNVLVFVPIGFLMGGAFKNVKGWTVFWGGLCLSVGIEASQFVFSRGFSEIDDVIHNTLGTMIGFWIIKGLRLLLKLIRFRRLKRSVI